MKTKYSLGREEFLIVGGFLMQNGDVIPDKNNVRIMHLVDEELDMVATDSSGWRTLYMDNNDGRYWELAYDSSEMHGGGPVKLKCLSVPEATARYTLKNKY